jgi:hypothetical protein
MGKTILIILSIFTLASCSKVHQGDWVHFSSYKEYVILNSGDTAKYEGGWNMPGLTSGATHRELNFQEQQRLLNYLDSICRTDTKYIKFEDKALKWKRNYPDQTLGYMMKFQDHVLLSSYQNISVQEIKTIVCDYDSTYQRYFNDGEKRMYYDIFE